MFLELAMSPKNRKQKFLEEMEAVIPWDMLIEICKKFWKESPEGR